MGGIDRRPLVIVRPPNADDVARVVALARETGLPLAVRSGGHSGAGHSVVDGGIVLDLRDLKALDIDVDGRTAWADAGLTAGEYTTAAAEHGLAIGFGDTGSVGLGGITLGGGVGYLVRKHGLTIDSLLAAEVVTADGELVRVDAEHHPDLFWAIRGGGGNFGVATRFKYRLHPVESIVGGMLILPATADTVAGFIAAAEAAPDELSTIANVMPCPPMPFVPEEQHGKLVIFALMAYAGDDGGRRARRGAVPRAGDAARRHGASRSRTRRCIRRRTTSTTRSPSSRTMFVDRIDRGVAETIMEYLEASDAAMRVAQLRVLGGAMARVPGRRDRLRPPDQPDHGQRRRLLRGRRRQARARGLGRGVRGGPPPGRRRRVRQLPRRRGRDARPRRVPGHDLGPAGGDQGAATTRTTCSASTRTSRRRAARRRPLADLAEARGPAFEVAPLRNARRAPGGEPVAVPRRGDDRRPSPGGGPDGVDAVMAGDPVVGVERRQQLQTGLAVRRTMASGDGLVERDHRVRRRSSARSS